MDHAAHLRIVRCCCFATVFVATTAAAADMRTHVRMRPYQPLLERNRITFDAQRLQGSPASREPHPLPRESSPVARPLSVAQGRDHGPVASYTPRWEMLEFCPERGFYPDVQECPAGWQRVRVDVGP